MNAQPRSRLTECLRQLGAEVEVEENAGYRFGPAGEFSIRVAASEEDRRRAWALAYRVYLEKEYAQPNPQRLWYSLHDALPETVTVLVERAAEGCGLKAEGTTASPATTIPVSPSALGLQPSASAVLIGAVTVVPDSPLGLPADAVFPGETRRLRDSGARLAEGISLVQAGLSERAGMLVVAKLCEFTCLVAQRLLGATDLVCTVNPRHEDYYRRVMLFGRRGAEAPCDKVSGAPAVFLTLNFTEMQRHIERTELPDAPRTIYRRFMKPGEVGAVAAALRRQLRPMTERELGYFFTDILARATPKQRAFIQEQYLAYELDAAPGGVLSRK